MARITPPLTKPGKLKLTLTRHRALMRRGLLGGALAALLLGGAAPLAADPVRDIDAVTGGGETRLPPYLQCVPYARQVSGIAIFGDAHTWWNQAEGKYAKGTKPKVGAVMAFRPHGNSRLGHVAAVSRIIDKRTVLIRHSNWSPINGRRGQIEDDVRAVDVSQANDWSEVRVWYAPLGALGGTHWPLAGFIYNEKPGKKGKSKPDPQRESDDPIGDLIASRLKL